MSEDHLAVVREEIEAGIGLAKCQKCGCMRDALDSLAEAVHATKSGEFDVLTGRLESWNEQMRPVQYACLGCEHCYAALALNGLAAVFPSGERTVLQCDFKARDDSAQMVVGEYFVLDATAHVAVSTLASVALAEELASRRPKGLAIVGKTETENIGIDKVVKNIVANPSIQYLILAGKDPVGHLSGKTLLALSQNGTDADRRVVGSPGKRPILRNVSAAEIEAYRGQVEVIDLIGCEEQDEIAARVEALSPKEKVPCG